MDKYTPTDEIQRDWRSIGSEDLDETVKSVIATMGFVLEAYTNDQVPAPKRYITKWLRTIKLMAARSNDQDKEIIELRKRITHQTGLMADDVINSILTDLDSFHAMSISDRFVTVGSPSIADWRDTITSLADEVKSLREALKERDNQLALSKLEVEALGSQLLDVQAECVELKRERYWGSYYYDNL